jgi:hypothetical protein
LTKPFRAHFAQFLSSLAFDKKTSTLRRSFLVPTFVYRHRFISRLVIRMPVSYMTEVRRWAGRRVRAVIGPLATRILELGTSVVFDFAVNTPRERAWVRSIFEAAHAEHVLHVLDVPDDECRRRVHARNNAKPAGLYFGQVSDAIFDAVLPHIILPADAEGFRVEVHPIPNSAG